MYRLAEKGQELFAHGYEELALALLEEVLYLPDTATVHQMLHRVSARLGRQFAERMRGVALWQIVCKNWQHYWQRMVL